MSELLGHEELSEIKREMDEHLGIDHDEDDDEGLDIEQLLQGIGVDPEEFTGLVTALARKWLSSSSKAALMELMNEDDPDPSNVEAAMIMPACLGMVNGLILGMGLQRRRSESAQALDEVVKGVDFNFDDLGDLK